MVCEASLLNRATASFIPGRGRERVFLDRVRFTASSVKSADALSIAWFGLVITLVTVTAFGSRMLVALLFPLSLTFIALLVSPSLGVNAAFWTRTWCLPVSVVAVACLATLVTGRKLAGVFAAGSLLKVAIALSGFLSGGDLLFHAHRLAEVATGRLAVTSMAPGLDAPLPVPYPPGIYVALLPLLGFTHSEPDQVALVGIGLAIIEATASLLVGWIALRLTGSSDVAWRAAAMHAVMPMGFLVLAKGILANAAAQFATLLYTAIALKGEGRRQLIASGCALSAVFLTHLGVTMNVLVLLLFWSWFERGRLTRTLIHFVIAAGAAIAAYYWRVVPTLLAAVKAVGGLLQSDNAAAVPAGLGARESLITLGKIVQNSALKLGVVPAWLAAGRRARGLNPWLLASIATYAFLSIVAVLTPVKLRFEYFATAPLCVLASMVLSRARFGGAIVIASVVSAILLAGFFTGRFDVINVILESFRWPLVGL